VAGQPEKMHSVENEESLKKEAFVADCGCVRSFTCDSINNSDCNQIFASNSSTIALRCLKKSSSRSKNATLAVDDKSQKK